MSAKRQRLHNHQCDIPRFMLLVPVLDASARFPPFKNRLWQHCERCNIGIAQPVHIAFRAAHQRQGGLAVSTRAET
jgi:hypothetical protein